MFYINHNHTKPIFEQIIDQIAQGIALGTLKPNDQLPPVRSLAKELGINPNTVSKAYRECELLGLSYSIVGKGSYVADENKGLEKIIGNAYEKFFIAYYELIRLGESKEQILDKLREETL